MAAATDPEEFVRRHQTGVWRYLRLLGAAADVADDLMQETFLSLLRRFDPTPNRVPLLRTIARGLWIDRQRGLRRRRTVAWADSIDAALAESATIDPALEQWVDALAACRERLPARSRRAVELFYRDGLGRNEVGRELELAPNTVRNVLASARDALRACIEGRLVEGEQE
ncbi:MAG: sigma-70 family RNA polymerase sigma factor [bacterium]|nr:sigma-70 family RNA polymerase sigma factor [bacterium]